ncbi:protein kinase domain-containing protein [Melittangium boletus]|uniref:non-specific serine/threonine protein kinase n=1 Tax=Melittangium boletus DSM 14713 TaxID=1294270 RepID=A0A250IHG9_9BACT|nr:SUMF1/EgtB/PvdO family nonheme iron enzyme [Melittangium boletus]ATB30376.1 serine/threonine protein kinase [Melittangium boletus DSM 14713]
MSRAGGEPPREFEEYRLLRPLGQGAMGQVYLAHDTLLERLVAVKFITPGGVSEETARARFFQEARAIARLQHPNVVAIHRVGEVRRRPYLVSEFIRGQPLDTLPRPVEGRHVLRIAVGLARGLAAAHRRGILHRDIKPANAVLSEEGEVKLLDFGLAELAERVPPEPGSSAPAPSPASAPERETRPVASPRETRPLPSPGTAPTALALAPPEPRASPPLEGEATAGTPLYLAPELWRGEPASRASDIYALGILLYELCTGRAPHEDVPLAQLARAVCEEPPRPLAEVAPALPPGLAAVVDRCLAADPARRYDSGDALREALEALAAPTRPSALPSGNPYRGLLAFDAGHRGVFFGREAEARAVVDRLRASPFVLVAGDSGVGKSSLCRAGVLPAVEESGLGDGAKRWHVAPWVPGRQPLVAIAEALAPVLGGDGASLAAQLSEPGGEPGALAQALRRRPPDAPPVLLFVDQLEELVTLSPPEDAARLVGELVLLVRRVPGVRVLGTARSDCLTRLMTLPGLDEELPRALHLLPAMSLAGLREAIVGPARALGVRFESSAVVESLVAATARTEGGLPLLQFALAELWEARDREHGIIPAAALEAMGGVEGALARHADGVVARLRPEQRPRARELLLSLVTPEGTRARRTAAELHVGPGDTWSHEVLEGLVRGRLLLAGETEGGEGHYELAHESLLLGWPTLRGWLGQGEQRRAVRHRLERAATEWERLGRPAELLYGDKLLSEVAAAELEPVGPREEELLAHSRRAARGRRLRRWALAASVPVTLLAGVGAVRWQVRAGLDATVAARLGEARGEWDGARRLAEESGRLRQEALARFDTPGERESAESTWARALEVGRAADAAYASATSALEATGGLAPGHEEVRERLADLLAERVALAEREGHAEQRAELLGRLAAYDVTGERRKRWTQPARLTVRTRPEGARMWLSAPGPDAEPEHEWGASPGEARLSAGSHLLRLEAPGRAEVRVPVWLRAGEALALDVALPRAGAVPGGFIHIPPGRFLQGSGEEALRRTFFNASPLHEAHTGAFLIARHEVTFADWMAWLDALPPAERAARLPGTRGARGGVVLEKVGGRWRLTLRPASREYVAWEGEPLRYGQRERRAMQDWRRVPISAISFEDAEAYADWLARTGRVPGARLCTEAEWERAARGADGRRFPSGDTLAPDDANIDVTYGREPLGFGPDEVGSHPRSRSPFGVDDMAGNVWEWVRSAEDPRQPVIRGGSWFQAEIGSQSANREAMERTLREPLVGLRLCATPQEDG